MSNTCLQKTTFNAIVLSAVLFAFAPFAAQAADVQGEINTAMTHAKLAASASDIDGVHMHLHHALNCLVGPGGEGFDQKQMNPCANSGSGAIPDTTDPRKRFSLQNAADEASAGIAETDLARAQSHASETAQLLQYGQ